MKESIASLPGRVQVPGGNKEVKLRFMERVLRARATGGIKSPHVWIITALIAFLGYLYYGVLTSYHDIYVILFFYPLIYASVIYRLRGVFATGLAFLAILLPYTLLFSHDAYSLARSLLFAAFAFLVSGLGATLLNQIEVQMEAYREIISLNEELNRYIARLQSAQKQLVQAEKLKALGQLSATIAHEMNNPLAGVLIYTKLLAKMVGKDSFDRSEVIADLSKIDAAVSHCSRLVRSLLDFARQSEPKLQPVAPGSVIDQALSLVRHQAEMKGVKMVVEDFSGVPKVMADFGQLQQVFINLIVNAIQATRKGGTVTVWGRQAEGGWVALGVTDTGCGIPPENMDKLFTPFFTTKDEVRGVGLGLSVSYGIIERHGGRIEVQSELEKGTTFTVYLPAAAEQPPA